MESVSWTDTGDTYVNVSVDTPEVDVKVNCFFYKKRRKEKTRKKNQRNNISLKISISQNLQSRRDR